MLKGLFGNKKKQLDVVSPVNGELVPIEEVNDPTFANKIMGDGIAVKPSGDTVVAPCDSKVIMISDTKHAVGLETFDGMHIIIHIGIDTVERKGQGFEVLCQVGDVALGESLVKFDRVLMEEDGVDTTVLMIYVDNDGFEVKDIKHSGQTVAGESVVTQIIKKKV